MDNILVSTGGIDVPHEIVGTTSFFFSTMANKNGPTALVDIYDYIVEKLKESAATRGADAIIHLRVDHEKIVGGFTAGSSMFAYCTLAKRK